MSRRPFRLNATAGFVLGALVVIVGNLAAQHVAPRASKRTAAPPPVAAPSLPASEEQEEEPANDVARTPAPAVGSGAPGDPAPARDGAAAEPEPEPRAPTPQPAPERGPVEPASPPSAGEMFADPAGPRFTEADLARLAAPTPPAREPESELFRANAEAVRARAEERIRTAFRERTPEAVREGTRSAFEKALFAPDADVQLRAIRVLERRRDARAIPALEALVAARPRADVEAAALGAIRTLGEHAAGDPAAPAPAPSPASAPGSGPARR